MKIIGTGSYLPEKVLTNEELTHVVETSDEWITERTGIKERHISTGEETSDLACKAAEAALKDSGLSKDDIDMIIVATVTPDYMTPGLANVVQKYIQAYNSICMDINAACSGFIYGLNTAHCYMLSGMVKNAIVISADVLSKMTDYTDRRTCVLFGDAAGAVVVQKAEESLYSCILGADATKSDALICRHAPLNNLYVQKGNEQDHLHMDGQDVFKFVMKKVPSTIMELLKRENVDIDEIKYFVLHQANLRINTLVAKKLGVSMDRCPHNLDRTGNTSSATVPVLLNELAKDNKLKPGDKIILCGFGGGLTWGAILLEW